MIPGLQTHIDGRVPMDRLREVSGLGYRLGRIDAMTCSVDEMLERVNDNREVGLTPIITLADPARIRLFEPGTHVSCLNECDGRRRSNGDLPPKEYREILDAMVAIGQETGVHVWGGVGSNTDEDTLGWGNEVRDFGAGWPAGMYGLDWHSYGPYPHEGFTARLGKHPAVAEFEWLFALANGLPILLSEFGEANTTGVSEEHQAEVIKELWRVWGELDLWGACQFQIHDGADPNNREHRYGIYRCDANNNVGGLKPVAYVVPRPPILETTFAVVASDATTSAPVDQAGVILSTGQEGFTNHDGYLPVQVEIGKAFNFSVHHASYEDFISDVQTIHENTDYHVALSPVVSAYPFPPESGRLHIEGKTFRTESGELWQWRGFSMFLLFLRMCRGEDIAPDLRWLRANGANIPRIFGPLPWKETPDYRVETFRFDLLPTFFALLRAYGLRCNWSLGHYRHPDLKSHVQRWYDIAGDYRDVTIAEAVNEPHVHGDAPSKNNSLDRRKPDPIELLDGIDRRGVLTSYGLYAQAIDGKAGWPPVLDFGTIHTPRDAAWDRKARMAQEAQHATGKPWISDEPAKAIELDFQYPGGKRNPDEFVFHHGIAAIYTPGSTLHTEAGKWGHVPEPGTLQSAIVNVVREEVWLRIDARWQEGTYSGSHMSNSPVHFERDVWAYSSILGNEAISVRVDAKTSSRPVRGWKIKDRWGPAGNLVILER